jgi:hypothetical protein
MGQWSEYPHHVRMANAFRAATTRDKGQLDAGWTAFDPSSAPRSRHAAELRPVRPHAGAKVAASAARMRGLNAGTGSSSGHLSTFKVVRCPQALHLISSESGPRLLYCRASSGLSASADRIA